MSSAETREWEPHDLTRDEFIEQVQTFSFWFEAVEGYLTDKPYGYDVALVPEDLTDTRREAIITTLCNYCVGEAAALEASSGMVTLAPNHHARIFMATQVADEARHLEVFLHRMGELGVTDPEAEVTRRANPNIVEFKRRLLELVAAGDWEAAVFAQNVLLETMEFTVFGHHARTADRITQSVLNGVISDERRHLGFGENSIGARIAQDGSIRERLTDTKRDLDRLVLNVFDGAFDDLGLARKDRPNLGRDYLKAVERLGLVP